MSEADYEQKNVLFSLLLQRSIRHFAWRPTCVLLLPMT